ncbi:hypothetical protein MKZ38_005491 [Zalerion maritima]|uniref:Serine hydrolase domain-containing protein n=1 Tax=Zalerion maritima TaxID=339359 RepID=A0AAD5WX46_9PEZI|nr:hypothetical protein MKZ38_005491 [Zalerion maritima]
MRPKILLLHGSGTNTTIFGFQTYKLASLLRPHFDLVYLEAPIDCGPGPGVLPFFEGAGPFKKWLHDGDSSNNFVSSSTFESESNSDSDSTKELENLQKQPEAQEKWDGLDDLINTFFHHAPVAGIIGFSQGAKATLHLVRWLEAEDILLDFVLLAGGTAPFKGARVNAYCERSGKLKTPSVHLVGDLDPWRPESEKLFEYFEPASREMIRFEGGHNMPMQKDVNQKVFGLIKELNGKAEGGI